MSLAALELNDSGLVLRWAEGDGLAGPDPSPACALLEGGALVVGRAAAARARLLPRLAHDRFWAELGTAPLPRPYPGHLRAADLAFRHLEDLLGGLPAGGASRSLLVAAPGSFTGEQLGLLLGMVSTLGLRVHGLVDAAVAASAGAAAAGRAIHVDLELHRAVVTELAFADGCERRGVRVLAGAGLAGLREAWARRVSALFVARTRFDPRSSALSEQALWDLLPDLARRPGVETGCELRLRSADAEHVVELAAADLAEASAALVGRIRDCASRVLPGDEPAEVLVSDRAASVPGLPEALGDAAGGAPRVLPEAAAAVATLRAHRQLLSDAEELAFHVRLGAGEGS